MSDILRDIIFIIIMINKDNSLLDNNKDFHIPGYASLPIFDKKNYQTTKKVKHKIKS